MLLFAALLLSVPASAEGEECVSLPIVMYHHISVNSAKWNDYVVSLDEFRADMDYLASNGWHSVSVDELLSWYDGEFDMPEKPFMLTFDDGFESTLAYAEPIVADHGFTGVVAVIGSVCDKFTQYDEHYPELSNLSWEDAAAMAQRGVIDVQCHTWDMHALHPRRGCSRKSGESAEQYRQALTEDLSRFLQGCGEHGLDIAPAIAYPYGAFSGETEEIVREMGFRAAFTCDEKINRLTGDDGELYRLARFNRPHGVSSEKFFSVWEKSD
jgi:peptidoglycan/xylan/chitin deacetylase (PgdA/CDA1 family)